MKLLIDAYGQPLEGEKLVAALDNEYGKRRNAMSKYYRQWELNENFYEGNHWIKWDADTKSLLNHYKRLSMGRELVQVERIGEYVRIMSAQLGSGKPDIGFFPATQSFEDKSAAKLSEYIHKYINRINNTDIINNRLHFYKLLFGTAIKKITWDTGRNEVVEEIIHPREILPRLDSQGDFDNVIRYRVLELDVLKTYFPGVPISADSLGADDKIKDTDKYEEPVVLKEYYEEPCEDYPRGRYIAWAGNTILTETESIYRTGRVPFVRHIFDQPAKPCFWGRDYVSPLIPLQVLLNKTMTMSNEYLKRAIKVLIAAERGADIDQNILKNADLFSIIEFNQGSSPPAPIQMPNQPYDVWKQIEMIEMQMMDLAHIHLVTKGMAERNVRSDAGMRTLREQDEHPLTITTRDFEQGEVEAAQMKLSLAKTYYPEGKTLTIVGKNNRVHVASFKQADISGEIDVVCEPNSAMPHSRALQQNTVLEMFQTGMIQPTDPKAKRLIKEMMQYNSLDVLFEEDELEKSQILSEQEALLKGMEIEVKKWENHGLHKQVHKEWMMSDDFLKQPDEVQMAMETHYDQHEIMEDEAIQRHAQRLAVLQGQPVDDAEAQMEGIANATV